MKTAVVIPLRLSLSVSERLTAEPRGTRADLMRTLLAAGVRARRHLSIRQLPRGRGEVVAHTLKIETTLARPLQPLAETHCLSSLLETLLREHYGMPTALEEVKARKAAEKAAAVV